MNPSKDPHRGCPTYVLIDGTLPSFQCRWNYPTPDHDSSRQTPDDLWYPGWRISSFIIPLRLYWWTKLLPRFSLVLRVLSLRSPRSHSSVNLNGIVPASISEHLRPVIHGLCVHIRNRTKLNPIFRSHRPYSRNTIFL